jgi:hypothetical protein
MKIRFWLGMILLGQAVGYFPLRSLYPDKVLYASLGLGIVGLVFLYFGSRQFGTGYDDNSPSLPFGGSEYSGSQSRNLADSIGDADD